MSDIIGPQISSEEFYAQAQEFVNALTAIFAVKQDETGDILRRLEKGELTLDQFIDEVGKLI